VLAVWVRSPPSGEVPLSQLLNRHRVEVSSASHLVSAPSSRPHLVVRLHRLEPRLVLLVLEAEEEASPLLRPIVALADWPLAWLREVPNLAKVYSNKVEIRLLTQTKTVQLLVQLLKLPLGRMAYSDLEQASSLVQPGAIQMQARTQNLRQARAAHRFSAPVSLAH
jgi:hypothetical protein